MSNSGELLASLGPKGLEEVVVTEPRVSGAETTM